MCGIIGYVGNKRALPILINGLRRLEYRGYDSAGVAVSHEGKIKTIKSVGRIDSLEKMINDQVLAGETGIAHTRWATHGGVTQANAHPHWGCAQDLVVVHNGIIENYRELKAQILSKHKFVSETDTEVLAHLIEHFYQGDLRLAVEKALTKVRGTYGLVAMHSAEPGKLIAARLGSPLVVGVGDGEYYIASDTSPMLAYTKNVVFLDDGEIAQITKDELKTYTLADKKINKTIERIDWDEAQAQKGGFDHFMLKEIFDQPTVFEDSIRGRIDAEEGTAHLGGLNLTDEQMRQINRVVFIACGTAYYAALIGKYAFERLAGLPVEVDVASEFRYRDPIIDKNTLVFAVSQSGETADTLAALREAKRRGAFVRGMVNVIGSTIARETDGGSYIHAGPELAVASTKAYTNMIAIMLLTALQFGRLKRISLATGQRLIHALLEIPKKMNEILAQSDNIKAIAEQYKDFHDALYLGRGINYPVALEGSHKLKEISYIHSEGYPAGEMKHGVNALLTEKLLLVGIMTKNQLYEKMRNNIEEVRARKTPIVLVANTGDEAVKEICNQVIYVPPTMELLEPLLNTIPLQLFAYYTAVALGRDVDRPRNLAKSVTVE
ncbi:MAG: glutamine--fructose-6-phosphate transaminase (isomerizing) [Candidatus Magasanikbacteria bacterium CG10_big_fil_rev_8_21_14_0_10_40_10]|uniref:Glutamine--fructose-6-phosphate aminotransferase [isomerizing] n=1 Tax=Candidatus Magasanikbacteria bacterium CG10_big_fil_rev_8_21_14_0_10_40_10 TaxID=1974648 RepID=A0A2M6W4G5_9BACT|nr:MAG: glutamine--fructose-6-phosphate transaminase (isomerizing) [Candidatus Magasanikbacteria bacterium CG10_big_fil_rev_8_21_14_0_10_40_10]